jgi:hypothetical protein
MRDCIVTLFLLAAGVACAHAQAGADSAAARSIPRESIGSAPLSQGLLLSQYLSRNPRDRFDPPSTGYLTISLNPLAAYRPATRSEAMLVGAGAAGTLAMFVGALGNTLGAFDEDTAWILTGAAAAAGAIYGGTYYRIQPTLRPDDWHPNGPPRSPNGR